MNDLTWFFSLQKTQEPLVVEKTRVLPTEIYGTNNDIASHMLSHETCS